MSARRRLALLTERPVLSRWQAECARALLEAGVPILAWLYGDGGRASAKVRTAAQGPVAPDELPEGLPAPALLGDGDPVPAGVDVLLDLASGDRPVAGPAGIAETWAFAYGDDGARDAVVAAMRAIVRGPGPMPIQLRAWPSGRVLRSGAIRTTVGSLESQLERLLVEPVAWPAQAAVDEEAGVDAPGSPSDALGPSAAAPQPSPSGPLLGLGVAARRIQGSLDALLRQSDWTIGLVRRPIAAWLDAAAPSVVSWLPRRPGRFAADPFGIDAGDSTHVLFEDFDQRRGRGVISTASVDASGTWSEPEIVVDTGSHASYPYLFEADGATWLIPETSDLAEVRLYRAIESPRRWTLETRLLEDTHVSDATVIQHEGRWWLFGTSRGRGVDEALRIWHAPTLTGPWSLHALDPVKIDAATSRPGGTPFIHDDALFRPAQDCSVRYGGRLAINRVGVLDERRFEEAPVRFVEPMAACPDGLHTLSGAGPSTLIDGNRLRLVADAVRFRLAARLRGEG